MALLYLVLVLTATPTGAGAATPDCATPDAAVCTEDGDPCTVDHCVAGTCVHDPLPDPAGCEPVLDAYRRTLGLGGFVADFTTRVDAAGLADGIRFVADGALGDVAGDLAAASSLLAGRTPAATVGGQTTAQVRAGAASAVLAATSDRVRTLQEAITSARPTLERPVAVDLARRARFLYRSVGQLKRELRRLQRVSGVFVR